LRNWFFGIEHGTLYLKFLNLGNSLKDDEMVLGDSALNIFPWCFKIDTIEEDTEKTKELRALYSSEREDVQHIFGIKKNSSVISNALAFKSKHYRFE
jgi:hypothetical protein